MLPLRSWFRIIRTKDRLRHSKHQTTRHRAAAGMTKEVALHVYSEDEVVPHPMRLDQVVRQKRPDTQMRLVKGAILPNYAEQWAYDLFAMSLLRPEMISASSRSEQRSARYTYHDHPSHNGDVQQMPRKPGAM